uniref:Uncharacterized protein n=1 Tax=Cacopsylla melanoneura TaxID=428564 RepID=A0A8D8Z4Z3_9HEMI
MVELMFFVNSLLIYSLFIQLSTKWTFLMKAWQKVEWDMRAYGYPPDFAKRCIWITSVIMLLAIGTHKKNRLCRYKGGESSFLRPVDLPFFFFFFPIKYYNNINNNTLP